MKILFDHGTPAPLRHALVGHSVATAFELGWAELENGALLAAAEESFELLITTDQNLRYQQDLSGRKLAILVLPTASWPKTHVHSAQVLDAVSKMRPGDYLELQFAT